MQKVQLKTTNEAYRRLEVASDTPRKKTVEVLKDDLLALLDDHGAVLTALGAESYVEFSEE